MGNDVGKAPAGHTLGEAPRFRSLALKLSHRAITSATLSTQRKPRTPWHQQLPSDGSRLRPRQMNNVKDQRDQIGAFRRGASGCRYFFWQAVAPAPWE